MAVTFASISHYVHTKLVSVGKRAPLGHVHQFVAAALGYNSYAAYKSSIEEPPTFDDTVHVVLDPDRLQQRQVDLGFPDAADPWDPKAAPPLVRVIRDAFATALPNSYIHEGQSDLEAKIHNDVANEINDSDAYISEQAMINAYGGDYDLTFSAPVALDLPATEWILEVDGTCSLDQDPDRVFHGDEIRVSARVVFPKLGRRTLGEHETQDVGAAIVDDWADDGTQGGPDPEGIDSAHAD